MIRRKVVGIDLHPSDINRRFYRLECGHTVNRNANGSKRWALCGHCEDEDDGLA